MLRSNDDDDDFEKPKAKRATPKPAAKMAKTIKGTAKKTKAAANGSSKAAAKPKKRAAQSDAQNGDADASDTDVKPVKGAKKFKETTKMERLDQAMRVSSLLNILLHSARLEQAVMMRPTLLIDRRLTSGGRNVRWTVDDSGITWSTTACASLMSTSHTAS